VTAQLTDQLFQSGVTCHLLERLTQLSLSLRIVGKHRLAYFFETNDYTQAINDNRNGRHLTGLELRQSCCELHRKPYVRRPHPPW
jgi:hypothetical protein